MSDPIANQPAVRFIAAFGLLLLALCMVVWVGSAVTAQDRRGSGQKEEEEVQPPKKKLPTKKPPKEEEEEQGLHQRGDNPQPVIGEADQLPLPHDPDRAKLGGQRPAGDGNLDHGADRGRCLGRADPGSRAHLRMALVIICIITRFR